ncbi:MAG TPA: CHRD domain-containing protein [Vicinamibacterales bacterium]|jgi:CHRD domain-containing protein|nr:CHRD domain-containing protein [Vicinamibacterales bacterium]
MRRVLSLAGAAALALLVGSASAEAQTMRFTALLSGANEVPGIASGSGGTATVTLNTATRAVTYKVDVYNMPSGTTQAHFHVGGPGVAGPVVVNFVVQPNISNDFSISGTATSADLVPRQAQGIGSWDDFIEALVLGQVYANVHSTVNPGGEIRGQVLPVPE